MRNDIVVAKTIDGFDIILETYNEKPDNFTCIICMYETENECDNEMEKILNKKLKQPIGDYRDTNNHKNISGRYCKIKTSHSYLCDHSFHTSCVHEWFVKSSSVKCPLCQQELELNDNTEDPINNIYIDEPKLIRTTYDFANGVKTTCEEYYVLYGKKHGHYKNYAITGYLAKECTYVNDLKEGEYIEYFPNKKIKSKYTYMNGKKNGKFWVKSQSGWYIIKGEYENDKFKGLVRRWDEQSRRLIFLCNYARGKKHGPEIVWYSQPQQSHQQVQQHAQQQSHLLQSQESPQQQHSQKTISIHSQLKSYTLYKNGVLDGFELVYAKNGILVKKAHHKNGVPHGVHIENYECGAKKCRKVYFMGDTIGVLKKWYSPDKLFPFSQLSHLEQYVLNVNNNKWEKDGIWSEWYRNGQLKRHMPYMFGKLQGRALYLNENGNPIEVVDYKNGKPHGLYCMYYNKLSLINDDENLKLHWVMQYQDGILHGKCEEYNTRGSLKTVLEYDNGILK